MPRPFTRLDHPSALVRHFIPGWFAVTMGTGVLALVLGNLPGPLVALRPLGEVVWALDLVLFLAFSLLFIGRLVAFPETIGPMLAHPVQSMFLGAIPMGMATLINGLVLYGGPRWGEAAYTLAHGLWWLDMLLALGSALLVPYLMFTHQRHALESLTAVWLLPIVAPEVAAASAGVLAPHLAPELARPLLVSGYLLWGLSLTLAFSLITLVLLRLALHKLPDTAFAATSWLPLGPLATGCLGLMTLGHAAPAAFAGTPLEGLGSLAPAAGLMGAFVLWGGRVLVAGDRPAVHPALPAPAHGLQPGVVGLHLPAGGVRPGQPGAAAADRHGRLRGLRAAAGRRPGAGLGPGDAPYAGRPVAWRAVPCALPEQPGLREAAPLRPSVIAPSLPAGRK